MPDENKPRRRRTKQSAQIEAPVVSEPAAADEPQVKKDATRAGSPKAPAKSPRVSAAKKEPQEPPRKIIISGDDDEPEWMVSAGRVSGAASRRTGQPDTRAYEDNKAEYGVPASLAAGRAAQKRSAGEQDAAQAKSRSVKKTGTAVKAKAKKPAARKKLSKKARARRAKTIRSGVIAVLAAAVVITLIVVGSISVGRLLDIKQTLDRGDGVFYPNIYVNNIPLGGKTLDEAKYLVTQQVDALIASWNITLRSTTDNRTWNITGKDLKMSYDVADQLDQLWAIGHNGSSAVRYEQVKALDETPEMRYTTLTYDMSAINTILMQIKEEVDRAPVSATKVYDETKWPPYSYTDDVAGQELDITGLNEHIMGMVDTLQSGTVDLSPTPVQAPITRAYLESQIVQLATYETSISKAGDYAEARAENIRIGTEKFDRLTIRSGEQVSFNKVTGLRSERNGFVVALELAYGKYVEGVGGGICQVSSTLYNAVVNAGLEVKTRTQHSLPSSYVEKGLDATVQDNRLDFVFKNSTSSEIFIDGEFYKGKNGYYRCRFTIWGRPDPNGFSYKLVSEVKETIPIPEMVYQKDKDGVYVIYDDEEKQVSEGQEGYIVDVYRVTMDKSGNEVARDKVYTDTYKAVAPVTYVGVVPRPTPIPEFTMEPVD